MIILSDKKKQPGSLFQNIQSVIPNHHNEKRLLIISQKKCNSPLFF